jgi:multicomponent Na+:H+ antiporter subunit D
MSDFVILGPVLVPLAAAFLLPFLALLSRRLLPFLCLLAMLLCLGLLFVASGPVFGQGKVLVYWLGGWKPIGGLAVGINLAIDAWGLFIALTIALIGVLAVLYSMVYMADESGREAYYILLMLLIAALIGFALTGDLFNQFVWLEILSFSAFALTAFHYEERIAVEGAFKYLITNSVAALFILVALALLYATTGALNLADAAGEFGRTSGEFIALGLLFAGYATKTALVPWHFWLPDAYDAAPAPVTAVFSGALSKVGIYAIGRLLFTLTPLRFNFEVGEVFLVIAALTMFVGGFQMLRQDSIKRILAYSSVSQMGYILMGLALGTPLGIAAACVHILNHALTKAALFFGAGSLRLRAGVSNLSEGGGLIRRMPATFGLMALAGLSLSGIPLTIGFISKTMLEEAAVEDGVRWLVAIAVISSVFTFAGVGRLLWRVFFGDEMERSYDGAGEGRPLALLAMSIPVLLSILVGVFPRLPLRWFAWPSAAALLQPGRYVANILVLESRPPSLSVQVVPPPHLLEWTVWPVPILVAACGVLLAYYSLPENEKRFWELPLIKHSYRLFRRWHSGLVTDYLLWNAFSTSVLLVLFVVIYSEVI